jgi:predicted nucleic acid-binding protein
LRLILDTSVLVSLRKGDRASRKALESRRKDADDVGISRLTEYELLVGSEFLWKKHGDAREVAWLEEALDWLSIYEIDGEVVREAAEVQADALKEGNPVPDMDLLIALSGKPGSELLTLDKDQLSMKDTLKARGVIVSSP